MIRRGLILMIRQEALSGHTTHAIRKKLGISKNNVKKYMNGVPKRHGLKKASIKIRSIQVADQHNYIP